MALKDLNMWKGAHRLQYITRTNTYHLTIVLHIKMKTNVKIIIIIHPFYSYLQILIIYKQYFTL